MNKKMQINRRVTCSKQQTEVAGQKIIKKIREDVRIQFTLYVAYILSTTLSVPWHLCHPPVGRSDTPTRTIRHCNDSPHKCFHIETSDPTGVGQSDHTQTAQFEPLEVGLNAGCDNPTHVQSDPFSASPGGLGGSSGNNMARPTQQNST
jgi:hypothetical protein